MYLRFPGPVPVGELVGKGPRASDRPSSCKEYEDPPREGPLSTQGQHRASIQLPSTVSASAHLLIQPCQRGSFIYSISKDREPAADSHQSRFMKIDSGEAGYRRIPGRV